ncbi:MAG: FtsK/SpoIIIE domain-containing protein [Moorella sp. (in: firmicutes)]
MAKREENALALAFDLIKHTWRHRPGNEIPAAVLDTFDALGFETKAGLKPVLAHKHKTPCGWHLVFNLPPGISKRDVEAKLDHFQEQTNGSIELFANGSKLHMDIRTTSLPEKVPYEWDPAEYPKMALPLPIGQTLSGLLVVDLSRLPHLFVAGNTGGGKTTFLRVAAVSLLSSGNVLLVIIDLKGLDFYHLHLSRHALVVDTDTGALGLLAALNREHNRRKEKLKAAGVVKLQDYPGDDLPWIVVIIDELAELQDKEAQELLNRLARLSRATGICLIAATQRPSHTLFQKFTDTRMLFAGRLCFHMPKPEDSRLILDSDAASKLPPNIPGRGIWKWDRQVEVQGMMLTVEQAKRELANVPPRVVDWVEQRSKKLLPR